MIENWRPVVGYEGRYEVSDQGRVRSLGILANGKNRSKRFIRGRILKHAYSKRYPLVNLSHVDGHKYNELIHQLVLAAFVGPVPDGQEVRHYDGNRDNCTLGNLLYGTQSDNYHDSVRLGGGRRGEKHPLARLNEDDVRNIRKMCASGMLQKEIAEFFEIDQSHVSYIKTGKHWGHL